MRSLDLAMLGDLADTAKRPDCFVIIPPGEKGPNEKGWPENPKNLATVAQRFENNPDINAGMLLGPSTGVSDIEIDGPDGHESIRKLFGGEPPEPTFNSRKGPHWLIRYDSAFDHLPAKLTADGFPGLEFRIGTKAAQTALPPSTSNGFTRTWASGKVITLPVDVVERIAALKTPQVASHGEEWEVFTRIENNLRDAMLATVLDWLPDRHGEPELVGDSYRIRLDRCPDRPDQDDGGATIFVNPGGKVVYHCSHSKCATRTINDRIEQWGPISPSARVEQKPSRFTIVSSATLAAMALTIVWLMRGILAAGQHVILGGNQKTLKTSAAADAAVSLASGTSFLGKFEVERAVRVLMMSGESGLAVLKETAERICKARGLTLAGLGDMLLWCESLPKFNSDKDIAELRGVLVHHKVEVLIVDPAYLCMSGDGAENLIKQGDQLSKIGDVCRELGVTFILLHHNKKARNKSFEPPTMEDLAWAGFSEFARQWWLLGRREAFVPGSGQHKLHFVVGGSAGHSGHYHVDVDEGSINSGRIWDVSVQDASVSFAEEKRQELVTYTTAILGRLADHPDGLPKTKLCDKIVPASEREAVLNHLVESGDIVRIEETSTKANRKVVIYKGAA